MLPSSKAFSSSMSASCRCAALWTNKISVAVVRNVHALPTSKHRALNCSWSRVQHLKLSLWVLSFLPTVLLLITETNRCYGIIIFQSATPHFSYRSSKKVGSSELLASYQTTLEPWAPQQLDWKEWNNSVAFTISSLVPFTHFSCV